MTYDARETGLQTGQPVELYEFRHGTTLYRYTSADTDQVFDSATYAAAPMSRNAIEATHEMARGALKIDCARTLPLLDLFMPLPPGDVITVTVRRFHRGDAESAVIWMGRVLNVSWDGLRANIHCESIYTSIKRPGLRRMYQKQCPHVLYSANCGVNRAAYKVTRTVQSIAGLAITFDDMGSFAAGRFAGGYVEWSGGGANVERRAIRDHSGGVITVNFQPVGLSVGATVDIYPGCDHTTATCNSKFDNVLNYGGMPYIPGKNPFDGTPIF